MRLGLTFRAAARTHPGSVRGVNEDAVFVGGATPLWAVADGMGGHEGGEIASGAVVDALASVSSMGASMEPAVWAAVEAANRTLFIRNSNSVPPGQMGCTVALLGVHAARFFCLWAGDSRVYRFRRRALEQLTRDHSYVQELIAAGALSGSEAEGHPQRNIITRAIGIAPEPELESLEGDVRAGDRFMLTTDGVWSLCTNDELAGFIAMENMEQAAHQLTALCLERGAPDNVSFVLVHVV
jgi:serine/threonine protein phosphatase Stp1